MGATRHHFAAVYSYTFSLPGWAYNAAARKFSVCVPVCLSVCLCVNQGGKIITATLRLVIFHGGLDISTPPPPSERFPDIYHSEQLPHVIPQTNLPRNAPWTNLLTFPPRKLPQTYFPRHSVTSDMGRLRKTLTYLPTNSQMPAEVRHSTFSWFIYFDWLIYFYFKLTK